MTTPPLDKVKETNCYNCFDIFIISDRYIEEKWKECLELGVYFYWSGSDKHLSKLTKKLEKICKQQVSISTSSKSSIYLHCKNKEIRNKMLSISKCYYKGHVVKFQTWIPHWNDEKEHMIPTWYECSNLPVEIKHLYTLFKIGKSIGKLIGIFLEYDKNSNVKYLINEEPNQKMIRRKKIITNRSIYETEFKKYEGEIKGII